MLGLTKVRWTFYHFAKFIFLSYSETSKGDKNVRTTLQSCLAV
ncbi:hypothetical protein NT08PM_1681 [Pasteurella multocida subsp. multocida str. 3480]|nr:hypothetical protein NT08PM_1681 [Pasteurella multocida subsp. multocida str. 3480]